MKASNSKRAVIIWATLLIFAVLPIFLQSVSSQGEYYAGIGASDYPRDKTIYVNNSLTVEIARLTNVGTLNFSVRSVWIPDHNSSDCEVELPSEFILVAGESRTVTCNLFSSKIANYSGKVEFICDVKLPSNFTGNPSIPGHTTKVNFIFKEPTEIVSIVNPLDWKVITIVIVTIGGGGIGLLGLFGLFGLFGLHFKFSQIRRIKDCVAGKPSRVACYRCRKVKSCKIAERLYPELHEMVKRNVHKTTQEH